MQNTESVLYGDSLWTIAARVLSRTAYGSVLTLAQAIVAKNPQIQDWTTLIPGTVVTLP